VSLTVEPGESVALVGRNGAGKSTLLRLITGIEQPTTGSVRVTGSVAAVLAIGVGFSDHLTGHENIDVAGGLLGLRSRDLRALRGSITEFSGLARELHRPLREYSSGTVARLGFALAVHVPADVLVIDETLSVGDEEFRGRCIDRIEAFRAGGGTLVFSSHEEALVERLASRVVRLRNGIDQR
jgi:ABC-type polysaccharide/polyol phosphate transport system ATPase subunit